MPYTGPPDFPIGCQLWNGLQEIPPTRPADVLTVCSRSPLSFDFWMRQAEGVPYWCTTIMRLPKDIEVDDCWSPAGVRNLFPTGVIVTDDEPEFYYVSIFSHIVGGGFPNEFRRVYAARATAGQVLLLADLVATTYRQRRLRNGFPVE